MSCRRCRRTSRARRWGTEAGICRLRVGMVATPAEGGMDMAMGMGMGGSEWWWFMVYGLLLLLVMVF